RRDRDAQRALYALTHERLFRLLLRMTRHEPEQAAYLLQDTYVRAFERIAQFNGDAGIATWLHRIAVNEALQFIRKSRRRDRLMKTREEALASSGKSDRAALQVELRDALACLPPDDRALLVMKYYEGMSYADIAEALGRPLH